jgi:hypothetical protein
MSYCLCEGIITGTLGDRVKAGYSVHNDMHVPSPTYGRDNNGACRNKYHSALRDIAQEKYLLLTCTVPYTAPRTSIR